MGWATKDTLRQINIDVENPSYNLFKTKWGEPPSNKVLKSCDRPDRPEKLRNLCAINSGLAFTTVVMVIYWGRWWILMDSKVFHSHGGYPQMDGL